MGRVPFLAGARRLPSFLSKCHVLDTGWMPPLGMDVTRQEGCEPIAGEAQSIAPGPGG